MGCPLAASHSRTVPSSPALARRVPSGENATAFTQPGVAFEGGGGPAAGRVPQPHRPVAAGAGQAAPSGANASALTAPPLWPSRTRATAVRRIDRHARDEHALGQ